MGILKKLFSKKQKSEGIPEKKNECWYNNAHEQGEHHDAVPMDAAGSVNSFEYGVAKSNAKH